MAAAKYQILALLPLHSFFLHNLISGQKTKIADYYDVLSTASDTACLIAAIHCGIKCNVDDDCCGYLVEHSSNETCHLFFDGEPVAVAASQGCYFSKRIGSYPANKTVTNESSVPKSCHESRIKEKGTLNNSPYTIDPLQNGSPIQVDCKVDAAGHTGTTIHHDQESTTYLGDNPTYKPPRSYVHTVSYVANVSQLNALAINLGFCRMHVRFKCHGIEFWEYRWQGPVNDMYRMTDGATICPQSSNIKATDGRFCQCGLNNNQWIVDEGYFEDNSRLPVTAIYMGDLGSGEHIEVTLGPMICAEMSNGCDDVPRVQFAVSDTQAKAGSAGLAYGDTITYTCFSGLLFPDGQTNMSIVCLGEDFWMGFNYTACTTQTAHSTAAPHATSRFPFMVPRSCGGAC